MSNLGDYLLKGVIKFRCDSDKWARKDEYENWYPLWLVIITVTVCFCSVLCDDWCNLKQVFFVQIMPDSIARHITLIKRRMKSFNYQKQF